MIVEDAEPIRQYVFTPHALSEVARRGIPESVVRQVIERPQQRYSVRTGRDLLQSKVEMEEKTYLIRVFVDVDETPAEVVTVYRTTKIEKYWRKNP